MAQNIVISKDAAVPKVWRRKIGRWVLWGSAGWLAVAAILLVLLWWWDSLSCPWPVGLYMGSTVLGSGLCFAAYGLDKRRAVANRWRISEATLQWLAFLGGWPGGLIGQRTFRHKTQKLKFQLMFWLIISLHVPLVLLSLWSIRFGS